MRKLYHVHLSDQQRTELEQFISRGKRSARVITRARILLKAAEGWQDQEIVGAVGGSVPTVARVRRRFVHGGLAAVLTDKTPPGRPRVLSSKQAAHLIAIACSPAPDGHDHWPLRLLGQKAVELGYVEHISPETIRQVLGKK
jgi:transposase